MAEHVEVVVKIPKYYLTHPQDYTCLAECVRRGTILPKGHGRLGDLDELEQRISNITDEYTVARQRFIVDGIRQTTAIIEADKEQK